ncbi:class I SAM-dependent methyltransferase [Mycobacterium heckeshornense]|uniref:S-adenosyl-L-methionine-dependent methyltransferase n=1 Tax=Mycobacterium heckeshornense TaxID=110505 RepID=A0A2G8BD15_9MYCO|nr:class I SAM-dependent methyltransferase [Mycobacterium heckeshornense]KMV20844.1 SAM-dependent methyltransferase [Mycobacterium heckeshornense]MCV7032981.1 class I SAM-dependent methyltransferase [Mycobacterium heckeshornense]PIJ35614.1 class I SAM-dependent methyltransferase [Mycobacterium heckeshornense]BCO35737.1 putative S-adenosyl-L-methionine-dependent methyltransferase [Mycobacterium heckeshornense]
MTGAQDDKWDLASGVGATATMVAAGRALASRDTRALIDDPFAEPLVQAVGMEFFTKLAKGELDLSMVDASSGAFMQLMVDATALRTKYFDEYFLDSARNGLRQAVILASGLDTRAYRLAWPPAMVVYEIDQPRILEFKDAVLDEIGAAPTAERRTVGIDLRNDWPSALCEQGFDPTAPTAWSAEGLLMYLPAQNQDRLCDTISLLSAVGSTIATEYVPASTAANTTRSRAMGDNWRARGFGLDMESLTFTGERSNVMEYLEALGWRVDGVAVDELFFRNGIERVCIADADPLEGVVYLSGTFSGRQPVRT